MSEDKQYPAPQTKTPALSEWSGWDQSNLPWSQAKHQDAVCRAVFGPTWAMEDAGALIGFIDRTWGGWLEPPSPLAVGWVEVPNEPTLEFLKSINAENQVLAYENGRYYNAWFEFEQSEGGWFWTDDADSEPNPSHYRPLSEVSLANEKENGL